MSKGGLLIYKCRKCGELSKIIHVPNVLKALSYINAGIKMPENWGPIQASIHDIHGCKDGTIGISDLIGGEEDA